ncbi:MAG: RES family NAD+ phosphorylase [Deltaproteobacteria bacterium]|nr:RES family NAD+ phosphorylase [Deltaproteobacteria bacterium]
MYSSRYPDPLGFGFSSSRFSDPRIKLPEKDRFGVIYLGSSLKVCFLERVLRDLRNGQIGDVPIPYAEFEELVCAEVTIDRPLNAVDLRGDSPIKMGVPTDAVRASSHRLGQRWSLAFWQHKQRPHGILYPSRLNEEICLALYDVALPNVSVSRTLPFLEYTAEVTSLIREFKLAIV